MIDDKKSATATNTATNRAFEDPGSKESKVFFEGARAIMAALEEIPADQHACLLAHKNQQHIMAVLLMGRHQRKKRKRQEARILMQNYDISKAELRGFIFDAPSINDDGRAMDANGEFLEDENFQLLPGKVNPGWPERIIYNLDSGEEISPEKYNQLSDEEKGKYGRYRTLTFRSASNQPVMRMRSIDIELVGELISRDIAIGDPVNDRYSAEIATEQGDARSGFLHEFRDVIIESLADLGPQMMHSTDFAAMLNLAGVLEKNSSIGKNGKVFTNDLEFVRNFTIFKKFTDDPEFVKNFMIFKEIFDDPEMLVAYRKQMGYKGPEDLH